MQDTLLFDLDGTLMDTAPEISDALNDTLRRHRLPELDESLVRSWIGDGARTLLARALAHVGAKPALAQQAWEGFSLDYRQRCGSRSTLFPGAKALLIRLREQGHRLSLLTNKEAEFAHRLLVLHGLADAFELVVAGDTLPVKKPHPDVVEHVLEMLNGQRERCLLVGDSVTDVRCARAAGIAVWLVRHGYPQGELTGEDAPDGFIEHFDRFVPQLGTRVRIS